MQLRRGPATAVILVLIVACSSRVTTSGTYREHRDPTAEVASPQLSAGIVGEDLEIQGRWAADVVTAATPVMAAPDAYTRATEFSQTRHEAGVSAQWQRTEEQSWSSTYRISAETDYLSQSFSALLAQEIFDRHATLSLGATLGVDRIGRADVADFRRTMTSAGLTLGISRILRRDLVAHLNYDLEGRFGYQSNPYRLVPVYGGASPSPTVVVPENHPERRIRHAVEPTVVWAATESVFVHGSYRIYGDDWGLWSQAVRAELWVLRWNDVFRGRLRIRGYDQRGARFYRARYDEIEGHRSGDYRLSDMNSLSGGARVDFRPYLGGGSRLGLSASYDLTRYGFANYAPRQSMVAHLWGLMLSMEWE